MTVILETHDITKSFFSLNVLNGVSLSIAEGSITGIIGPNGAGKSTFFNVLSGWGYELSEDDAGKLGITLQPPLPTPEFAGWVKEFAVVFPEADDQLRSAQIFDDESYVSGEGRLSPGLRKELGLFRLTERLKSVLESPLDPCDFARASPPWFLERDFDTIDLSVRVANAFSAVGIKKVEDLAGWNREMLTEVRNFGRKSVHDLLIALQNAIDQGPSVDVAYGVLTVSPDGGRVAGKNHYQAPGSEKNRTLLESMNESLNRMDDRTREIVARRMGLGYPPETLQELGDRFVVTRERIRQIEAKAVDRLVKREVWDNELTARLSDLIVDRSLPLPLRGLDGVDPWFAGMGREGEALAYILENVSAGPAKIVQIEGTSYIGSISQDEWDEAVRDARQLLISGVERSWSLEHCKAIVGGLLPERCREFRDLLWERMAENAHFVQQAGESVLSGFGRGAENYVYAVLASSDVPLHYSVIADKVREKYSGAQDARTLHNAAASVGFLFGRGIYGVDRHIPISDDVLKRLGDEAYEIMRDGPDGRQWHSSELVAELLERDEIRIDGIDKYLLDIALHRVDGIHHLGRFVWALTESSQEPESFRIDIRQSVASVLQEAGGPLSAEEIRRRVSESRGMNGKFQIYASDPVVRISHGVWGLNDRDLKIKRADQRRFHEVLVSLLRSRGIGIHITELPQFKSLSFWGLNAAQIVSVALLDERVGLSAGRYLFLREWGGARRETVRDALAFVLLNSGASLRTSDLSTQISLRLGRTVEYSTMLSQLLSLASYDPDSDTWAVDRSDGVDENE